MTIKDFLGPFEYFCWQLAGYGVFAIAWIVIALAFMHGVAELRSQQRPIQRMRPRRQPIPFPRRTGRVIAFPGSASRTLVRQ